MTESTQPGNLGGLGGANALCLNALTSSDWQGKTPGLPLTSSNVRAWLCDDTNCQNHRGGVLYRFARAASTAGGNTLYVDFLGRGSFQLANGPGGPWQLQGHFGAATYFWGGRDAFSQTVEGIAWEDQVFSTRPEGSACRNWTSSAAADVGSTGNTNPASCCAERQWQALDSLCNSSYRVLCIVDPVDSLDRTPDDVVFAAVSGAELNTEHTASARVTGVDTPVPAIVLTSDQADTRQWTAQLRNLTTGEDWTNKLTVHPGDVLELRSMTPGFFGTTKIVEISIGDRAFSWSLSTRNAEPQLNTGHLLLTSDAYSGALGGLAGASALCMQEASRELWPDKGAISLSAGNVEAFLCDAYSCTGLHPSAKYVFNRAGVYPFGYSGGAFFYTDAMGLGPWNDSPWTGWSTVDGSLFFGANFPGLWSGRAPGSSTVWSNAPSFDTCDGWTSNSPTKDGTYGSGDENDARRWSAGKKSCDTAHNFICAIHPPANGFGFADVLNAQVDTQYSATATLQGLTRTLDAQVVGGDAEIRKNGGAWATSIAGLANGDTVGIRMTSSRLASGAKDAYVRIGDATVEWLVRNDGTSPAAEHIVAPPEISLDTHLGYSLALSDGVLVVAGRSALYVYTWSGSSWDRAGTIEPPFGLSAADVSIDRDVIVVGDYWDAATHSMGGVAAIYEKGADWNTVTGHIIRPSDDADGNQFGRSTAVSGDLVVIGNKSDKIYFYEKMGTDWSSRSETIQTTADGMYHINRVLRIRGNTVAVGTSPVNEVGSVHLFEDTGGGWSAPLVSVLRPADGRARINGGFGSFVDLSQDGRTLVVGAGDTNLPMPYSFSWEHGLVFVYEKGTGWADASETVLAPPVIKPSVRFGQSVNIQSDVIAIGAPGALGEGAVYLFRRGSSWSDAAVELVVKDISASAPAGRMDGFGIRSDLCGSWLATGAPLSPVDSSGGGAVYVHDVTPITGAVACP